MDNNTHEMLDSSVFDVWSGSYDEEVRLADENDEYPFAGYKRIMDLIFAAVAKRTTAKVLDVGIGTGTLATALYGCGHIVTGIDFSSEMLAIARSKMPDASFYQCNFADGLPAGISGMKYDFIISTYALHHLPDELKAPFIKSLLPYLSDGGVIIIGDIGFPTRIEFDECHKQNADDWDDDEYYFVFSELIDVLKDTCLITYNQMSHCAGIIEIQAMNYPAAETAG
jgi:putative AdoMet-dependent methyltransferase